MTSLAWMLIFLAFVVGLLVGVALGMAGASIGMEGDGP